MSNANDMPKTGPADVVRFSLAAILLLFGLMGLISSMSVKNRVVVTDESPEDYSDFYDRRI